MLWTRTSRYLRLSRQPPMAECAMAGHAGMETVIANLLEPGDKIIVGNNGIWGSRVCDLAGRYNGEARCKRPQSQSPTAHAS